MSNRLSNCQGHPKGGPGETCWRLKCDIQNDCAAVPPQDPFNLKELISQTRLICFVFKASWQTPASSQLHIDAVYIFVSLLLCKTTKSPHKLFHTLPLTRQFIVQGETCSLDRLSCVEACCVVCGIRSHQVSFCLNCVHFSLALFSD